MHDPEVIKAREAGVVEPSQQLHFVQDHVAEPLVAFSQLHLDPCHFDAVFFVKAFVAARKAASASANAKRGNAGVAVGATQRARAALPRRASTARRHQARTQSCSCPCSALLGTAPRHTRSAAPRVSPDASCQAGSLRAHPTEASVRAHLHMQPVLGVHLASTAREAARHVTRSRESHGVAGSPARRAAQREARGGEGRRHALRAHARGDNGRGAPTVASVQSVLHAPGSRLAPGAPRRQRCYAHGPRRGACPPRQQKARRRDSQVPTVRTR